MASLTKRTIILVICRSANYCVLLLSPIILVRIFDIHAYGQYREFILYATLFSGLLAFSVNNNLLYFIPKYPELERESISHTALFTLVTSSMGIIAIYLKRGPIIAGTSYDFIVPLILFLFFFLNLDFYESYWLGRKRPDYVLLYSTARAVIRILAILAGAFITRNVLFVIKIMVLLEVIKCFFLLFMYRRLFAMYINKVLMKEQLKFIVPLGSASLIYYLNNQLAKLFISVTMGVQSLALYTIGAYQVPIVNVVRSSVMDILFPEMTLKNNTDRLHLWQRANVIFCSMVFPVFVIFFYYAETFIETLFTKEYLAAAPLFRIYLFLMLRQCFEMGTPLRSINLNKFAIIGNILSLAANIGLIFLLFKYIGFIAPAIAFIVGDMTMALYLGRKILQVYRIRITELFMWKKLLPIILACLAGLPILFLGEFFEVSSVGRAIVCSVVYLILYFLIVKKSKVEEVDLMVSKILRRL